MNEVEARSRTMRAVKSRNTKPERAVRRVLFGLGYRYRLHQGDLPGRPDIVFSGRRKVVFVHGCFWHGHNCPRGSRVPIRNREYWVAKISKNVARDRESLAQLASRGWGTLVVWECELRDKEALGERMKGFLQ